MFQNETLDDLVPPLFSVQISHDINIREGLLTVLLPAARSPVFSHLSSSLQGLWTIRAFRAEQRFQNDFDAHQDLHSGALPLFSDAMESLYYVYCYVIDYDRIIK